MTILEIPNSKDRYDQNQINKNKYLKKNKVFSKLKIKTASFDVLKNSQNFKGYT